MNYKIMNYKIITCPNRLMIRFFMILFFMILSCNQRSAAKWDVWRIGAYPSSQCVWNVPGVSVRS